MWEPANRLLPLDWENPVRGPDWPADFPISHLNPWGSPSHSLGELGREKAVAAQVTGAGGLERFFHAGGFFGVSAIAEAV